jgi:hypothetical protein
MYTYTEMLFGVCVYVCGHVQECNVYMLSLRVRGWKCEGKILIYAVTYVCDISVGARVMGEYVCVCVCESLRERFFMYMHVCMLSALTYTCWLNVHGCVCVCDLFMYAGMYAYVHMYARICMRMHALCPRMYRTPVIIRIENVCISYG